MSEPCDVINIARRFLFAQIQTEGTLTRFQPRERVRNLALSVLNDRVQIFGRARVGVILGARVDRFQVIVLGAQILGADILTLVGFGARRQLAKKVFKVGKRELFLFRHLHIGQIVIPHAFG